MRSIHQGGEGLHRAIKTVTFDGTSGNGATGTVALFTTTGLVNVALMSIRCTDTLTEAGATATISCGVTSAATLFAPNPTGGATDLSTGEIWIDVTPDPYGVAAPAIQKDIYILNSIIFTIGTQNVTGGTLEVVVQWLPMSADGNLVAA